MRSENFELRKSKLAKNNLELKGVVDHLDEQQELMDKLHTCDLKKKLNILKK